MNRHVGASFTLSVLVVVFFAVVLYQPDRPPPAHSAGETPEKPPPRAPIASSREVPDPTPGTPLFGESPATPIASIAEEHPSTRTRADSALQRAESPYGGDRVRQSSLTTPTSLATSRSSTPEPRPTRRGERSAFTQVGDGETLSDIAVRVYGSTDAAQTLWLANRDILNDGSAPLRRGTLLRTPW